jgi:hypothetical protein
MAYNFNGSSQSLSLASAPVNIAPLTLACWFNSSSTTTNQRLIHLAGSEGNDYFDLGIRGADAGDPVAAIVNNASTQVQIVATSTGYSANTWHHACGVFASSTSRTAYIDGGSSSTGTLNSTPAFAPNRLRIGVFGTSILSQYFNGLIAEVGIWSAALTAAEIASLARGMTCDKVRPQSLVFYAPLVRDLNDQKGGRTITNNNGATVANHTRVYA